MNLEDLKIVKKIKNKIKKYPDFKVFIASKTGGNAKGDGEHRSVILARYNAKSKWFQFAKVWGNDDEERAKLIIQSK
jgi:hypothetical protein